MRSLLVAALALSACGDVAINDAGGDAYVPDAGSPVCDRGEMLCNNTCANVLASDLYCGNCTTQCNYLEACLNGACRRRNSACEDIRVFDPGATDGAYLNENTGKLMYCDFSGNMTYDDITIGVIGSTPAGYAVVRGADFNNAGFAKAFIGIYNKLGGIAASASFTSGNCCIAATATTWLNFGSQFITPGLGTSPYCNMAMTPGSIYTLGRSGMNFMKALPGNFFTTYPGSEGTTCANSNNPAYYVRRHTGLN
jgi:hypothetical protein